MQVHIHDSEDNQITTVTMSHAPAKGDILWLTGIVREIAVARHKTGAFQVTQVCHWVSNTEAGHSVCVYVKPVRK